MTQQDDYFYEIQLTNKQLVFYFMAGAAGLILSFLAGVMVGRGVGVPPEGEGQRVTAERVVSEETPRPASTAELNYTQMLESDGGEALVRRTPGASPRPGVGAASPAATPAPTPRPTATPTPAPTPTTRARPTTATPTAVPTARPTAKPSARPAASDAKPVPGTFTVQVGAFKDRATADAVAKRLKTKGFTAFVISPDGGGLFNVRVGSFDARADAESVRDQLRAEKFEPFIVRQ